MGMRLTAWGAGALVAAFLLAGCGGGEDSDASGSISKEQFIAKADAICKEGNERMASEIFKYLRKNRVDGSLRKPSVEDNEKFIVAVLIPNVKREIEELEALGVPEGDEERVEAMIAALEDGLETAESDTTTVAEGTSDIIFGISSRLAGEYGLKVCGSR